MNNCFLSLRRLFLLFAVALLPIFTWAQNSLDSLPPIDSLSDWQVNELTKQMAAQAYDFEQVLSGKRLVLTAERAAVEENCIRAKADSTVLKTVVDSFEIRLKTAKNAEKVAIRQLSQATKTLELANKSVDSDNITQRKNLRKLWKETRQLKTAIDPPVMAAADAIEKTEPKPKRWSKAPKNKSDAAAVDPNSNPVASDQPPVTPLPPVVSRQPSSVIKKYDPAADVMLHPPALPCVMAVNTQDEFSGERYRSTMAVELFRNTPPALKNYLAGKPNVQCAASMVLSGASAQLQLTFTINDPSPRKAFGKLDKNSPATLWFMDGTASMVYNLQTEEGVQNPENQSFVIKAQSALPSEVLKRIQRTELDKIRITWGSGYEDYDVQYVRLLMEQAKCLID